MLNSVVGQEQLFTELTPEEGAAITGGADFFLKNNTGIDIPYTLNGVQQVLQPKQEFKYVLGTPPVVKFDADTDVIITIPQSQKLNEGHNYFVNYGNALFITPVLPI